MTVVIPGPGGLRQATHDLYFQVTESYGKYRRGPIANLAYAKARAEIGAVPGDIIYDIINKSNQITKWTCINTNAFLHHI